MKNLLSDEELIKIIFDHEYNYLIPIHWGKRPIPNLTKKEWNKAYKLIILNHPDSFLNLKSFFTDKHKIDVWKKAIELLPNYLDLTSKLLIVYKKQKE